MAAEFTCACCGLTFEKGWSDEEASQELEHNFGGTFGQDDCALVCDDCYRKLKAELER